MMDDCHLESIDAARLSQVQKQNLSKIVREPKSLDEAGYNFNQGNENKRKSIERWCHLKIDGKFVQNDNGQPFEFAVFPNHDDNQRRYNAIGRLVDQYVYHLLQTELKLRVFPIPVGGF